MNARALYYPYTAIHDEGVLKTALLLWDELEIIVPWREFPLVSNNPTEQEALDLIGYRRVPTESEKALVHREVKELLSGSKLPRWFFPEHLHPDSNLQIYSEKLMEKTWRLLEQSKLAGLYREHLNRTVTPALGLSLMTMLANACAGQNREKITDRIDAHDAYARFRAAVYRGEIVEARNTEDNLLVTASFDAVDVRPISLQRLVELRSREDALMRELRAKYRKAIAKAKENLAKATNLVDKSDVFHDFKRGMSDDFEELRKALRMEAVKSFVAPLLLCLICLAGGVPPKPALAASAIAAIPSFRLARKKTLKEHETAWLYAASNKIPTV